MATSSRFSDITNAVLVCCALLAVGILVRREFFAPTTAKGLTAESRVVPEWREIGAIGHREGPQGAKVVVVEFGDFECPACRRFEMEALRPAIAKYGSEVAFVFRHWPLSHHRFAYPAARAAECAATQGRFQAFKNALYARQDSLGLLSWAEYAQRAEVPDLEKFTICNKSTDVVPSIELDSRAALDLKAPGTPAILINETLYGGVPDSAQLDSLIRMALQKSGRVQ